MRPERFELPTFWFVGQFSSPRQTKPASPVQRNKRNPASLVAPFCFGLSPVHGQKADSPCPVKRRGRVSWVRFKHSRERGRENSWREPQISAAPRFGSSRAVYSAQGVSSRRISVPLRRAIGHHVLGVLERALAERSHRSCSWKFEGRCHSCCCTF